MRLRRKEIADEVSAPPVVQPYDDSALRAEIALLKAQLEASMSRNSELAAKNHDLLQKLLADESKPEDKCDWAFDVEYNDDLTIRRVVARETSVGGSSPKSSSRTILYS